VHAPLVARIPLEAAVSAGGDAGKPVALTDPHGDAGRAFAELAARIAEELLPPVEMSGCSARLLDLVEQLGS
jgi:ATP-binding protein involved in chromosome partitioning